MKEKSGKFVFVFPGQGQGSIKVGMGLDIYKTSLKAREIFNEADRVLGRPLSRLCFFGPEEKLYETKNSQLASLVVNLAYVATHDEFSKKDIKLESIPKKIQPDFLAGHSVGYIAALVYAGAIDFKQALEIVKIRGELMAKASKEDPGSMIVLINPDLVKVDDICREYNLGGNFNSESQVVLSGRVDDIESAKKEIIGQKIARKIIPLLTEGAFHSECMRSAVEPFRDFLEPIIFNDPKIPVIGNSRAQAIVTADEAKKELVDHLCLPVLWRQSMDVLARKGVTHFIEIGHGEVLSGNLMRSSWIIAGAIATVSLSAALAGYFLTRHKKSDE